MTSKGTRLSNEIKALYDYVNRDEYNIYVVEVMLIELQDIVKRLKHYEKQNDEITKTLAIKEIKKEAENIAIIAADEECYSDLIVCTTKEDYEKFIEKWEDYKGDDEQRSTK